VRLQRVVDVLIVQNSNELLFGNRLVFRGSEIN
jgi:hypothetical protein